MRRILALLFASLLHVLPAAAQTAVPYTSEAMGYSVTFPAKPNVKDETVDLGDGQSAKMNTVQILAANAIFDVTVAEYPKGTVQSIGEDKVLDNARDGAVANAPGPLISEAKIDFAGRPARELTIDMSMNHVSRNRIFVIGDRLFNVGAVAAKDKTKSEAIEVFFSSFKLSAGGADVKH